MITLYLVSAEHSSVCLFYCNDTVSNLSTSGADQVIGRVEPFAAGSIAYDSNGDIAIWDGTTWNVPA